MQHHFNELSNYKTHTHNISKWGGPSYQKNVHFCLSSKNQPLALGKQRQGDFWLSELPNGSDLISS